MEKLEEEDFLSESPEVLVSESVSPLDLLVDLEALDDLELLLRVASAAAALLRVLLLLPLLLPL